MEKLKVKKVLILLATYNGGKFLGAQIESLLNQKNVDVYILARDDGSSDNTIDILKSYKGPKLDYYIGQENLGAPYSFLDLIANSDEYDFYAYCDQDDVWMQDKLCEATKQIEGKMGPVLYVSNYDVVDEKLTFLRKSNFNFKDPFILGRTIVRGCPSGCTMVFNLETRNLLRKSKPEFIRMHDYWTMLTVEAFHGTVITDDKSRILYRQHSNNTVGFKEDILTKINRFIKSAVNNKNERQLQANSLLTSYGDSLPEDSRKILYLVRDYRNSLSDKCKLLKNKELRPKELEYRLLFFISVVLGVF